MDGKEEGVVDVVLWRVHTRGREDDEMDRRLQEVDNL
jgi:hypothetical protein